MNPIAERIISYMRVFDRLIRNDQLSIISLIIINSFENHQFHPITHDVITTNTKPIFNHKDMYFFTSKSSDFNCSYDHLKEANDPNWIFNELESDLQNWNFVPYLPKYNKLKIIPLHIENIESDFPLIDPKTVFYQIHNPTGITIEDIINGAYRFKPFIDAIIAEGIGLEICHSIRFDEENNMIILTILNWPLKL